MKIRNDFVTNSSSSSYIIAYKNKIIGRRGLKKSNTFFNQVLNFALNYDGGYEDEKAKILTNQDSFTSYFIEHYSWDGAQTIDELLEKQSYLKSIYDKAIKYLKNGYNIAVKEVDYGSAANDFIDILSTQSDSFIVISKEA